jgi:transposase
MQASTLIEGRSEGLTLGLDLGDRTTHFALLDARAQVVERGRVTTTRAALQRQFAKLAPSRVVLEVSTHSPWVSAVFRELGHSVIVANPRSVKAVSSGARKSDRIDAELLARLGRADPELLHPVEHRGERAARLGAAARPGQPGPGTLVAHQQRARAGEGGGEPPARVRGRRIPPSGRRSRARRVAPGARAAARGDRGAHAADPRLRPQRHGDAGALSRDRDAAPAARGGPLTSLVYVLVIEDPQRFTRSRMVAAYLGLVPRRRQSGDRDPELHISRAGDRLLRKLLVECAQYTLGQFGEDSDLRRWGLSLAGEGSRARKRRAVVAVARKLATVLHHLWVSGEVYAPLRQAA